MKQCIKKTWFLLPAVLLSFCISATAPAQAGTDFSVASSAITPGQTIPAIFTCKGKNISPPLSWSGVPAGTKSLALVVDDPDAPVGIFTHWIAWNIPTDPDHLDEGISNGALPEKMTEGINDFHRPGYNGPCPPPGRIHHYRFTLYAIDTILELPAKSTRKRLFAALTGHIIGTARFIGLFSGSKLE